MKKKETLSVKITSFFILILMAEIFMYFVTMKISFEQLFITPVVFLIAKICYDLILAIKYKEKIFIYFEDYLKEIALVVFVSFIAIGVIYLTEHFLMGNVRISVLAAITSLYLKK